MPSHTHGLAIDVLFSNLSAGSVALLVCAHFLNQVKQQPLCLCRNNIILLKDNHMHFYSSWTWSDGVYFPSRGCILFKKFISQLQVGDSDLNYNCCARMWLYLSQTILNTRTCTVFCCKERVLSSLLNGTFYEIMTPSGFMFII